MKLSPLDIQQQQFRRVMRGYSIPEVHQFLDAVCEQMMDVMREGEAARTALQLCTQERDSLREREEQLKDAMLTAQSAVEQLRGQATREAELVVQDAQLRAEKILAHAQGKVSAMSESCQDLRRDRVRFEEELRGLINTYARLLEVKASETQAQLAMPPQASVTVLERLRPPAPPFGEASPVAAQPS
jgi:cell division initiation protein